MYNYTKLIKYEKTIIIYILNNLVKLFVKKELVCYIYFVIQIKIGDIILKKYCFVFSFIFLFVFGFSFLMPTNNTLFAQEDAYTNISSIQDFETLQTNPTGKYRLTKDISFSGINDFEGIELFSGEFDGNGYTLSDLTITSTGKSYAGIFNQINNATIKNLQLKNISVSANQTVESEYLKAGIICGNMISSRIEEVSIIGDATTVSTLSAVSKSRSYVGLLAGNMADGSVVKNCYINGNVVFENTDSTKTNYVGGLFGYVDNSSINFVVQDVPMQINKVLSKNSFIGGLVGTLIGSRSSLQNVVSESNITFTDCDEDINAYSVIGQISLTLVPDSQKINYLYSTSNLDTIGNIDELNTKTNNGFVDNKIENQVDVNNFYIKNYYLEMQKFDNLFPWNFNSIWQLKTTKSLPTLQHFDSFTYSVDEAKSFDYTNKPKDVSNIITFITNPNNTYRYGDSVEVGGYINDVKSMNKFFRTIGIRKDGAIIFENKKIEQIIDEGNVDTQVDKLEDKTIYKNNGVVVTETETEVGGNTAKTYSINTSNILWSKYTANGNDVNLYTIPNGDLTNVGIYSLALETINYSVLVKSENANQGTVKRSTASVGQKEFTETNVAYGNSLNYTATPTSDFGFNGWYRDEEKNTLLGTQQQIKVEFNEKTFEEGGIFNGLTLGEDDLLLYATFTKKVCDITIKFAVNDEITDDILSTIKFNGSNVQVKENMLTVKAKMGDVAKFTVSLPAGYEFSSWFQSDGTSNIGTLGDTLEIELDITNEDESMVIVANFKKEVEQNNTDTTWIWITCGIGGGLLILGLVIFFIIKNKRGGFGGGKNDYKKMYY